MSLSLYRKYRPQNFADVSGQKAAIDVITNSIAKNRVGHAYLFSGSRGCGKTSVARIFAKALNCLDRKNFEPCGVCKNCQAITAGESLDVIEIDGASNNSVDEVRELKVNVTLAPFNSKYKIYIIDEVHMLSTAAFNALLKTLEEPPEHVIFILATTEPHKVPVTIRSRCQHIPFHSITTEDIFSRLEFVCKNENVDFENEALWEISRQADGALRDALSLLEQIIAAGSVSLSTVEKTFGAGSRSAFERWVKLFRSDMAESYTNLKSMFDSGASGVRVFEEMFALVKNLWLVTQWENITDSIASSEHEKTFLTEESKNWNADDLHRLLDSILKILAQAKSGVRNDILLGMFMLNNIPVKAIQHEEKITIPQEISLPSPSESPIEIKDTKIEYDSELKQKLLEILHEKNFVLFCGFFHTQVFSQDGILYINIDEPYIFDVLKQYRNSSDLANIFSDFESVILRFNGEEFKCERFSSAKKVVDAEIIESETPIETETESKNSYFQELQRVLKTAGLSTEIIMIRREEEPESESESEEQEIIQEEENL